MFTVNRNKRNTGFAINGVLYMSTGIVIASKAMLRCKNFSDVDVLVEAFDHADQKIMLIEEALESWPMRPLVAGSGMAGFGETENLHIRKVENLYICGDEVSEISDDLPPLAPKVGIVANMQADKVIEVLVNDNNKTHYENP